MSVGVITTTVEICTRDSRNHTGNGWWAFEPGLHGGGGSFQIADGKVSQAKGTAEEEALRHKHVGVSIRCSLHLEDIKGKGEVIGKHGVKTHHEVSLDPSQVLWS